MPERYMVEMEHPSEPGVRRAIDLAVELAKRHGCDVLFLTPVADNLIGTTLSHIYSPDALKRLMAGKGMTISGVRVRHASWRTLDPIVERGVVVSFWPTARMFAKIDEMESCRAIIVAPQTESQVAGWRERWSPTTVAIEPAG